ncbi:MAG: MFS transporter [Chloroflexi bacterium]|nr:MFS transporter [Chloroflexota bacterium]
MSFHFRPPLPRRITPQSLWAVLHTKLRGLNPRTVEDRNALFVAVDGVTVGLSSAAGSFLSVFVVRLGADAFWVSLLSSLPALIHLTLTLPLSRLVERRQQIVRLFAWTRLIGRFNFVLISLLPFFLHNEAAARAIVIMWAAEAILTTVQELSFTLVMNRSVSRERRASQMSGRWTAMGVADIISLAIAGQVLERIAFPLNYQLLFFVSFLIGLLGFGAINQVKLREEALAPARPPAAGSAWQRLRSSAAEILERKAFVHFETGRNIYWLGLSMVLPLISIFWVKDLQASDAWVSYFGTTFTAATLFFYGFWVRMKRKRGTRWALLASALGRSLYPLFVSLTQSPLAMLAAACFHGVVFAGVNILFFEASLDTMPRGQETRFLAVRQTVISLTGAIGPPVGALLLPHLGMRGTLATGTAIALVGVAIFVLGGAGREIPPAPTPPSS